jgi:AcrR family transcriptional regulator
VVTVPTAPARAGRGSGTRGLILTTAERLFAERGVFAVSNRQVSAAAGQGNNAAVGYHVGTKTDLVRALAHRRNEEIEQLRRRMVDDLGDSPDLRDWIACLVRPVTDHLAALGNPGWYARFRAQVMTDPVLREILIEEALTAPSLHRVLDGLNRCLLDLPADVHRERWEMSRQLIEHMCAERERALAEGRPTPRPSWHAAATGLIDALVGMWLAPVTPEPCGRSGAENAATTEEAF